MSYLTHIWFYHDIIHLIFVATREGSVAESSDIYLIGFGVDKDKLDLMN